jgi:hypothetical protein
MQAAFRNIEKPKYHTELNAYSGTNKDIISAIHAAQPLAVKQCASIAHHFSGGSERKTCENIWKFLKTSIKYKADGPEVQQIKLPSMFLHKATGDCKSYSLFTSGVLTCLGIPHSFKYVSYTGNPTPSHVYVVTKGGTIIDGVFSQFNAEKPYKHSKLYPMRIETINGYRNQQPVNGRFGDWVRDVVDKVKDTTPKKVFGAPSRAAYLVLIKVNWFGWASRMYAGIKTGKEAQIRRKWTSLGGDSNKLIAAVRTGARKRALFNKNASLNGIGDGGATLAASLAAAAATIASMKPLIDQAKQWLDSFNSQNGGGGYDYTDPYGGGSSTTDTTQPPTGRLANIDTKQVLIYGLGAAAVLMAFKSFKK